MSVNDSNFSNLIKEIAKEEAIELRTLSGGWVFHLSRGSRSGCIFGYQFGLNPDSVQAVCSDKCTASEWMALYGIPHVDHWYFMNPAKLKFADPRGNWKFLLSQLKIHKKLVLKDNTGTGGEEVYLAADPLTLEAVAHKIFERSYAMAVSPYLSIGREYRAIVLNGTVRVLFSKERPSLTGDGQATGKELYARYLLTEKKPFQAVLPEPELERIPKKGERIPLLWKHNLGQGAKAEPVTDPDTAKAVSALALSAAGALNARFVSVDIIESNGTYLVMEVNSGVMMENFCAQKAEYRALAKEVYREAMLAMLI